MSETVMAYIVIWVLLFVQYMFLVKVDRWWPGSLAHKIIYTGMYINLLVAIVSIWALVAKLFLYLLGY